ncbi:MAG TPA: carbohydrate ABC transporter permease [Methylomirabilota bacterium]|nr:carbohydrate ABC transporter permease [Methylomirabilota bacterium]
MRRALRWAGFYAFIAFTWVPIFFVFYWMVATSVKTFLQNASIPPLLFPWWGFEPTAENWTAMFAETEFWGTAWNSLVVAAGCTALALGLGIPCAYGVARWRYRGLAASLLLLRIAPGVVFLVPWFILFTKLGWVDSYRALILTHAIVSLPLVTWLLVGFFEDLPRDLDDAARVDGCSVYDHFWRIALPLVKPGLITAAILSFIASWNNFLFSLILAQSRTRTLPVILLNYMSFEATQWGKLAAASTVVTLPVLLLTLLVQRHIISGLTTGAVKG